MLCRVITAVADISAITSVASAQDVKLPKIEFGRYHALVIYAVRCFTPAWW